MLFRSLWPLIGGVLLAMLLARCDLPLPRAGVWEAVATLLSPARRVVVAVGRGIERVDGALRHWPAAGLFVVILTILFGVATVVMR